MSGPKVRRLSEISLTVADLAAERAFYEALGFRAAVPDDVVEPETARVQFGVARRAQTARLALGEQSLALVAFDPPGAAYPLPRAASDPWFQHFAIAVSDMPAAYAQVSGQEPVSEGGPQRLPPSTGSVTAYKFRDPEGHPLELSYLPGSAWLRAPAPATGPFLGIDHTALAVSDLARSLAFYVDRLGFALEAQLLNVGPEQDRLDGLAGVQLDIALLRPTDPASPHIELLAYRRPRPAPPMSLPLDSTATVRTRLEVEGLGDLAPDLEAITVVPPSASRRLIRDPDGHSLELVRA